MKMTMNKDLGSVIGKYFHVVLTKEEQEQLKNLLLKLQEGMEESCFWGACVYGEPQGCTDEHSSSPHDDDFECVKKFLEKLA